MLASSLPLPSSSAYYQTSASKAIIINRLQEKVEGEVINLDDQNETEEERNTKKVNFGYGFWAVWNLAIYSSIWLY